jgi:hypothetical protein
LRSDVVVEERGIIVLLEKQVHLQKDVGAEWALVRSQLCGEMHVHTGCERQGEEGEEEEKMFPV